MSKTKGNISSSVRALIAEPVEKLGYTLWDVEYVKDGPYWYLRITIDREEGVDIDDCEKVHRTIDPLIDEADPIEDPYYLEVSSPGLERELKEPWHYEKYLGRAVTAKLFSAVAGQKSYTGALEAYDAEGITLGLRSGEKQSLPFKSISKLTAYYDYESEVQ